MRITAISDTHNRHAEIIIEPTDILLHAGDFSGQGSIAETKSFLEWFSKQPAKHKIFISGNHDWLDYENPSLFKEMLKEYPDVIYLKDEMAEVEGLKIWGRPWTPEFCGWAFMADRGSPLMYSTLSVVPTGMDILLTHGPAYKILDLVGSQHVGCEDLLNELDRIKPKIMVCGHLHSSHGIKTVNGTKHINAAMLNDQYKLVYSPTIFEL